jgi:hypothetical protein
MLVKRFGIAMLATASVASCGGRTDITPSSVRLADFPSLGAQAFCGNVGHCCTDAGRQFDQANCQPTVEAALEAQFQPAPGSPATADTTVPEACLATIRSAAAQCRSWFACAEVLEAIEKHGVEGQPCAGTCSRVAGTLSCDGTNVSNPDGRSPCFASDGLFCNPTTGSCQRRAALGQTCSSDLACENGRCDANSMTCSPFLAEGSACGQNRDVLGCAAGLICETPNSIPCDSALTAASIQCVCTRTLPDGSACSDSRQCASSPCNDGLCQGAAINSNELQVCSG